MSEQGHLVYYEILGGEAGVLRLYALPPPGDRIGLPDKDGWYRVLERSITQTDVRLSLAWMDTA